MPSFSGKKNQNDQIATKGGVRVALERNLEF